MITVHSFKSTKRLIYAKSICLKYSLYVPGWTFQRWLKLPVYDFKQITIAFYNNIPIGCMIVIDREYQLNCGFYVKKLFRRKGIGRLMYIKGKQHLGEFPINCRALDEQRETVGVFFDKLKINVEF